MLVNRIMQNLLHQQQLKHLNKNYIKVVVEEIVMLFLPIYLSAP